MFSCNIRILIRQRIEDRSAAEHFLGLLLYNAVSEYHADVAVATAVKALDAVQHYNILLRVPPNFPHHM